MFSWKKKKQGSKSSVDMPGSKPGRSPSTASTSSASSGYSGSVGSAHPPRPHSSLGYRSSSRHDSQASGVDPRQSNRSLASDSDHFAGSSSFSALDLPEPPVPGINDASNPLNFGRANLRKALRKYHQTNPKSRAPSFSSTNLSAQHQGQGDTRQGTTKAPKMESIGEGSDEEGSDEEGGGATL